MPAPKHAPASGLVLVIACIRFSYEICSGLVQFVVVLLIAATFASAEARACIRFSYEICSGLVQVVVVLLIAATFASAEARACVRFSFSYSLH